MPIEAVKIPQNVYVEDHIVGSVTLKQIMICGIGAGISYVIYATLSGAGITQLPFLIGAWIPAVIAAAFAFLKINDLSMFNIILLMIEGINKPKVRYWSPHPGISINLITGQSNKIIEEATKKAADTEEKLHEMTKMLEAHQKALNTLTRSDVASDVDDTKPIKSMVSAMEEEHTTNNQQSSGSSLPVNRSRIRASTLDPHLSIDTIHVRAWHGKQAFQSPTDL